MVRSHWPSQRAGSRTVSGDPAPSEPMRHAMARTRRNTLPATQSEPRAVDEPRPRPEPSPSGVVAAARIARATEHPHHRELVAVRAANLTLGGLAFGRLELRAAHGALEIHGFVLAPTEHCAGPPPGSLPVPPRFAAATRSSLRIPREARAPSS